MKAIVLSGGAGTRLRPLSLLRPKPMVRLCDQPLLGHILPLLRDQGFTQICLTLQYLAQSVTDWFGDGSELGLSLTYRVETEPLGTAGAVRACADFIGGDDVLVISGDAACALDLRAFADFHRQSGALATILTQRSAEPMEYGLVLTGEGGQVRSFLEKPAPDRVYTDLVNTGIYMLRAAILEQIPESGPCDFGGELFPKLLAAGQQLMTWQDDRYWNDVGSCDAYLQTNFDALDGRLPLPASPTSQSLPCIPPCWVSPEATVSPDARLGPYAVVGAGSVVSPGCRVVRSVLDGAVLGRDCTVDGAILCQGVQLGAGCQVLPGSVLADGVTLGAGSLVGSGVRLWPGKTIAGGSTVLSSQDSTASGQVLRFDTDGLLRGAAGTELTPELLLRMGRVGFPGKRCGAASGGGDYAALLASAFLTGSAAAGRTAFLLDAESPAQAAFAGSMLALCPTLFVLQTGNRITLYYMDEDGLPIPRKLQRELEAAPSTAPPAALPGGCGRVSWLRSLRESYLAAAAAQCGSLRELQVSVTGGESLRAALALREAALAPPSAGVLAFRLSGDGLRLEATDERGRSWDHDHLLCALTLAELSGSRRCLCLPYAAPAAAETIAREQGGCLYRLGRDGKEALAVWRKKPFARDGVFLALRLCNDLLDREGRLGVGGELANLMDRLPEYHLSERVVELEGGAARLRTLAENYPTETISGLRGETEHGSFTVRALDRRRLRILAEGRSMEAAASLCSEISRRLEDGGEPSPR